MSSKKRKKIVNLLIVISTILIFSVLGIFLQLEDATITGASHANACVSPTPNLRYWWTGDGHTRSIVGVSPPSVAFNGVYGPGRNDQSFKFNGLDQYVVVNDETYTILTAGTPGFTGSPSVTGPLSGTGTGSGSGSMPNAGISTDFGSGSFSVEAWFNPYELVRPPSSFPSPLPYQTILSKGTVGQQRYEIVIGDSTINLIHCRYQGTSNLQDLQIASSSQPFTPGAWHHVVCVFDKTNNQIIQYVNGVRDGLTAMSSQNIAGSADNDRNLLIGVREFIINTNIDLRHYFVGRIDEVRLYNGIISETDVQRFYTNAICRGGTCGNNLVEGNELCDGTDLHGQSCLTLGFERGNLVCGAGCILDTSACSGQSVACPGGTCLGDINTDTVVSGSDNLRLFAYVIGVLPKPAVGDSNFITADTNCDGQISSDDLFEISKALYYRRQISC